MITNNIGQSTCLESHSSDKTFNVYKNIVIEVEEFDFGVKALKAEKFKACQVQRLVRQSLKVDLT